jgi:hypothetical protein
VKVLAAALVSLLCGSAYALGPLPNGQYAGRLICVSHNPSYNSQADNLISVDDKTMVWGSESGRDQPVNRKTFAIDPLGFLSVQASNGEGQGYLTKHGIHYTITLNIGGLSVPGEDTFVYSEGKLYLVSSATIANELVKCEGVFSSRVEALRP